MELIISNRESMSTPLGRIEYCVPFREDRRSNLKPFIWEDFNPGQAAGTVKETSPCVMYR